MSSQDNYESVVSGADAKVAEFDSQHRGAVQSIQHALHVTPSLVPLVVLIAATVVFALLLGDRFLSPFALTLILQQVQIVGIVAVAQSLVIITAGIDLSVGAIMVLSSVVMGRLAFFGLGIPVPFGGYLWGADSTFFYWIMLPPMATGLAILLGLLCGMAIGLINGWLVARVKLPPFIVTLGMWQIVLATNFLYSANETIRAQDIEADAPALQFFGRLANRELVGVVERSMGLYEGERPRNFEGPMSWLWDINFTYGVIFMLILFAVMAYVMKHTAWGRHVYAVGDDPEAAALSGVNTRKIIISVYMLAGLICAFAGWALIGRIGSVSPTSGQFANIESITAVVIGGISLFGGRGSILGPLFGALIVGVFTLGLRLAGADAQWTYLLIGVLIIAAVAVDQWIRKVSA